MDIVLAMEDGKVIRTVNSQDFVRIESREDVLRGEFYFKVILKGGTELFNDAYNADVFFDNEVPEAPVTIDVVSHDVNKGTITIQGYQTRETLLNIKN